MPQGVQLPLAGVPGRRGAHFCTRQGPNARPRGVALASFLSFTPNSWLRSWLKHQRTRFALGALLKLISTGAFSRKDRGWPENKRFRANSTTSEKPTQNAQ